MTFWIGSSLSMKKYTYIIKFLTTILPYDVQPRASQFIGGHTAG